MAVRQFRTKKRYVVASELCTKKDLFYLDRFRGVIMQ